MTAAFLAALLIDTRGVTPDFALTHAARAALAADPTLKDANVVISVIDGGVVAGGPVPTDAAADRVAAVLRTVPGVKHVRVACWVPAAGDTLGELVRKRVGAADDRPVATVVAQRFVPDTPLLLDPATVRGSAAPPREFPTIPPPKVPVAPADDVATAVEAVRTADAKFAGLSAGVKGSVVTIAGTAADAGDAWALAAAVRKVPGVERVVVGRVRER